MTLSTSTKLGPHEILSARGTGGMGEVWKAKDIRQIAAALGVTNILEGSVRKAGNRIRVTAQLITAEDGSHFWSERYDRAIEQAHKALERDPHFYQVQVFLGLVYLQMGKFGDVIRALETSVKTMEHDLFALQVPGFAYARAGKIEEAQKLIKELQELADKMRHMHSLLLLRMFSLPLVIWKEVLTD
jgi:tetratricopeptide (TPR) repeat protein